MYNGQLKNVQVHHPSSTLCRCCHRFTCGCPPRVRPSQPEIRPRAAPSEHSRLRDVRPGWPAAQNGNVRGEGCQARQPNASSVCMKKKQIPKLQCKPVLVQHAHMLPHPHRHSIGISAKLDECIANTWLADRVPDTPNSVTHTHRLVGMALHVMGVLLRAVQGVSQVVSGGCDRNGMVVR